jgi:TatD DNase family protein
MLIDIHAHLDLYDEKEVGNIIKESIENNVKCIITNSVDLDSCKKNLEFAKKYKDVVKLAVGFYPQDALSREEKELGYESKEKTETFEQLKEFTLKNKEFVFAIGETGLDFYNGKDKKTQEELFKKELKLAEELKVPIIIHSRKAEKEVVELIKDYSCVRILHCFNGKFSLIKQALESGCYFSIPTNIVRLEHFKKMVQEIPKDRILTETDAPFLSPYHNSKNKPYYIKETIKEISKIWKLSEKETEKIIFDNFKKVFNCD